jgi:hypothetical protein
MRSRHHEKSHSLLSSRLPWQRAKTAKPEPLTFGRRGGPGCGELLSALHPWLATGAMLEEYCEEPQKLRAAVCDHCGLDSYSSALSIVVQPGLIPKDKIKWHFTSTARICTNQPIQSSTRNTNRVQPHLGLEYTDAQVVAVKSYTPSESRFRRKITTNIPPIREKSGGSWS